MYIKYTVYIIGFGPWIITYLCIVQDLFLFLTKTFKSKLLQTASRSTFFSSRPFL